MKCITGLFMAFVAAGCSIHAPEVRVTGERTTLEQQVLGQYQELSRSLWAVGSTRALPDSLAPESGVQPVAEAIRVRRFFLDDRLRYLAEGRIAEGYDGLLKKREDPTIPPLTPLELGNFNNFWYPELGARKVILDRLRRLNPGREEEAVRIFAGIQRDEAPPGAYIENERGQLVPKR